MKPSLQLRLGQQLAMTPQLQQAIRLLQLSSVDLQSEIQTALESNTMLELKEPPPAEPYNRMGSRPLPTFHEHAGNALENLQRHPVSLRDHLALQVQLTPFSDTDKWIAAAIIDSINEDGYFTGTPQEIIATVGSTVTTEIENDEVLAVLHRIQQFDPLGVGAQDLRDCLSIQLAHLPHGPIKEKASMLVTHHLALLAKRDYHTLAKKLKISRPALQPIIELIRSLHPRPGTKIGSYTPEYIVPDVYTYKRDQSWLVELNTECAPSLQINHQYANLIRRADTSTDNQFLRTQLQEARWFLKSIENRHETLLKVALCIVNEQQAFLEHGHEFMKPLILQDIAQKCDLHESTISRVTTQKYLHTPRGTFELKYFFSSGVSTNTGEDCSAIAIQALIKKFISQENQHKPLSDSKLSSILAEQGIQVARRTVAKYREGVKIPPSNERKVLS